MGDILGIGITHYPPLLSKPETYANLMRIILNSPMVPPEMRQPESRRGPCNIKSAWSKRSARYAAPSTILARTR